MAIICICGHKKSNHENQRDDGRFTGKCKGTRIDNIKHPCGCSFFATDESNCISENEK